MNYYTHIIIHLYLDEDKRNNLKHYEFIENKEHIAPQQR